MGEDLEYAVLGIGVNVSPKSVPDRREVDYPAACVEEGIEGKVSRIGLLVDIVGRIGSWLSMLDSEQLHSAFEEFLAFRGQPVMIANGGASRADTKLQIADCSSCRGGHHIRRG